MLCNVSRLRHVRILVVMRMLLWVTKTCIHNIQFVHYLASYLGIVIHFVQFQRILRLPGSSQGFSELQLEQSSHFRCEEGDMCLTRIAWKTFKKNSESERKKAEKRFKARLLFQRVTQNFMLQRQVLKKGMILR